jgi:prepilin-type N-terminal cleavage/methylation domain-containing protein
MITKGHSGYRGFTLLEVLVSLGIFVFAITVILTSMGTSATAAANDARRSQAVEILNSCFEDISLSGTAADGKSAIYRLQPIAWSSVPAPIRLWFNAEGKQVTDAKTALFECKITATKDPAASLGNLDGRIVWPAKRKSGSPDGVAELFTSVLLP